MLNHKNKSALKFNNEVLYDVLKICEPLFNSFGITVFGYSHFLNNGTYLDICTHAQWQEHYIKKFAVAPFVENYIKKIWEMNTKYVLWDNRLDVPREELFSQFIADSCDYNIWHGFSIYEKHESSLEVWHFATEKENYEIINFYLNRLDILHHFILFFKTQAQKIIDTSNLNKLIIFNDDTSNLNFFNKKSLGDIKKQDFTYQNSIKKFSFNTGNCVIFFSKQEVECMRQLSESKTIKEIAREMKLSPRTVESYLNNIKKKSGCVKKLEIISLFKSIFIQ